MNALEASACGRGGAAGGGVATLGTRAGDGGLGGAMMSPDMSRDRAGVGSTASREIAAP